MLDLFGKGWDTPMIPAVRYSLRSLQLACECTSIKIPPVHYRRGGELNSCL